MAWSKAGGRKTAELWNVAFGPTLVNENGPKIAISGATCRAKKG